MLSTLDICFLAALYLRAEQDGLASFEEELVFHAFEQVCNLVEPGLEGARKRATHSIQRLRNQRLLVRVDATGTVSAGEFALTSLANLIVRSFPEEEQLTRESLALLTGAVISSLGQIRAAAQRPARSGESAWRSEVLSPVRITVDANGQSRDRAGRQRTSLRCVLGWIWAAPGATTVAFVAFEAIVCGCCLSADEMIR